MNKSTKICKGVCGKELPISEFPKNRAKCHSCFKAQRKHYRDTHKEQLYLEKKRYRENNAEKIKQKKKKYREDNRERLMSRDKLYYETNKEKIRQSQKEKYKENREQIRAQQTQYRLDNLEECRQRDRKYRERNKDKINEQRLNSYHKASKDPEKLEKRRAYRKTYQEKNKEQIKARHKEYMSKPDTKERRQQYDKEYKIKNEEEIKTRKQRYYQNNKETINKKSTQIHLNKIKTDVCYNIRQKVSHAIRERLKISDSSKARQSILKFLPYTIEELKQHLESLFETWMNWNNYGQYIKNKWNDNDPSTWTWQIDHIIPHSTFEYKTMDCEEFRKCWALENLRPLSSKQNQLDGATKVRHKLTKLI